MSAQTEAQKPSEDWLAAMKADSQRIAKEAHERAEARREKNGDANPLGLDFSDTIGALEVLKKAGLH